MAKQREATGLDNRGKWRLLSGMTDIFIPHEIRPIEGKDSSQVGGTIADRILTFSHKRQKAKG